MGLFLELPRTIPPEIADLSIESFASRRAVPMKATRIENDSREAVKPAAQGKPQPPLSSTTEDSLSSIPNAKFDIVQPLVNKRYYH